MSNSSPPTSRECVLLFARTPVAGHVKTRLEAGMSAADVLELYRCMVEDTVAMLRGCRARVNVCFTPPGGEACMREWLGELDYTAQIGDHLGARMRHAFEAAFAGGFHRAVCVGTDIPELTADIIHAALDAVSDGDVPLGPATDGGYYLIGCDHQRVPDAAFAAGMPWGAPDVFDRTNDALRVEGFSIRPMPRLQDIDEFRSLEDFYRRSDRHAGSTGAFLKRHFG